MGKLKLHKSKPQFPTYLDELYQIGLIYWNILSLSKTLLGNNDYDFTYLKTKNIPKLIKANKTTPYCAEI